MTPKGFFVLAGVTLLTTIGAVVTAITKPSTAPVAYVDEPVFPALRANPDAVAKLTIQTKDGSVTLTRVSPETWIAPDHYEYPAAVERINRLVRQLNDMRLIEAKTSNRERFNRLEVEDQGAEAQSRLIRLEDEGGQIIAEALIGKRVFRLTGSQPSGIYLRRPGEEQSWLASGGFELDPEVETWLDQLVVGLPGEQIAKIEITSEKGDGYVISRKKKDEDLSLDVLADGETPNEEADLTQLANAITSVSFSHVKPKADVAWPSALHTAAITTFDGLDLTIELALIDDEPWATFVAETATGADISDLVKQEAESINNRTAGWVYQINQSLFQRLTRPRSSWINQEDGTS